jgi:hypothetical protein
MFQPCDQIEIMAMARRAAVRDRHAMLEASIIERQIERPMPIPSGFVV